VGNSDLSIEFNVALISLKLAEYQFEKAGFTDAIGADKPNLLALVQSQ
jgi:hypothetical protein